MEILTTLAILAIVGVIIYGASRLWTSGELDITPTSTDDPTPATTPPDGDNHETGWRARMKEVREQQWVKNAFVVLGALVLIHIGAYLLLDGLYGKYFWNYGMVFAQIAIGAGFAMRQRKPNAKPPQHFLGNLLLVLAVVVIGKYTIWSLLPKWPNQGSTPGQSVFARTSGHHPHIPMGTPACFKEKLGPDKDLAYAKFPGQFDVLAVLCRESRFNHFETDGDTVLVNENKNDQTGAVTSTDTGIAQINSVHDAELKNRKLDKEKVEDNLEYAKILYEKNGLLDWTPRLANNKVLTFEVPVDPGEGSIAFKLPFRDLRVFRFDPSVVATLFVTGADGVEHQFDIYPEKENKTLYLDEVVRPIRSYRFKSKNDEKVLVTVTYQY